VQGREPGLHFSAVRGRIVQRAFDSAVSRGVGYKRHVRAPQTAEHG
jgi:hypothetical protein